MRWIIDAADLFLLNSRITVMRMMAYRVDFVLSLLVSLGFSALGPLFQLLIFTASRGYPGWTFDEILVFQSCLFLIAGLCECAFGSIRASIDALLRRGEFDRVLLKPWPPLLLILSGGFNPAGLGTLVAGTGLLIWSTVRSGAPVGPLGIGLFLIFLAARLALQAAIQILYCFFTVRWVYTMRLGEIIDKIMSWGNYPQELFPRFLRIVFVTVIPFAAACYWPAKALLGSLAWTAAASLVGVGLLLAAAAALWRKQLEAYTSAGG